MLRVLISRLAGRARPSETDRLLDAAAAARGRGDLDRAAELARHVMRAAPERPAAGYLLAEICLERGDNAGAEALMREMLQARPDDAHAHELLGQALRRRGAALEASHALCRAIEINPASLPARSELAGALAELGRPQEAIDVLRWVLKRDPDHAAAHLNSGIALQELGRLDEAATHFARAAALEAERAEPLNRLAMCLRGLDRHADALRELDRAMALAPGDATTLTHRAIVLRELGMAAEARDAVAALVAQRPAEVAARSALAAALADLGDTSGARAEYDAALALAPGSGDARLGRALLRLALGDFAGGWEDYEGRFDSGESPRRGFPQPELGAEPAAGKTVLVYAEQGLGDEIMFASCLPDLIAEARAVVVECDPRLESLFRRAFPTAAVCGAPRTWDHAWLAGAGAIDVQIAAGSLPRRYRRGAADFPARRSYLAADPARVHEYRSRLATLGSGRKIGIAWRGGLMRTRQRTRSLSPEDLAPLVGRTDLAFVSLQHRATGEELARLQAVAGKPVAHWPEAASHPEETAALIGALDAVVTVCSSVVHLGGALGARVIALVPAAPEWRYLRAGDRMPWYPSVELLRQTAGGDWTALVRAAARRI
ncbi:MAG: tetratricopeptide repeat protein [Burkholderiales bacterium]|nr:tetratricopeptide repeat protein [Burkholderiales bacterium]